MHSIKRIVMNTGFLYGKMIISMVITLYSVRLVLNAMGVEDYGIYNLIAGVIAMLSFLNAAMTASTQRYLSFYLGSGKDKKLRTIFQTSVMLHLFIGLSIVLILELVGIILFNGFLNVPIERIPVAKLVYHFMVISTFFTINAVPYDSAINAHEDMFFDAIVGIFESFAKLGVAIWLIYYSSDRLLLYGISIASLTILIRIIKSVFCTRRYKECGLSLNFIWNKSLLKEMFNFAGWNTFGAMVGLAKSQGIAVILNLFFGTMINAAYGIAYQVNGQVKGFAENMLKALRPQIIKREGQGERQQMLFLSMMASKYSFFLLALFAVPLIFEMNYVLKLWLKDVPDFTVIFCQLILISSLTNLLTIGLQTAIQAIGKIRRYQSVIGGITLLNLPFAWLLLKFGYPAYSVLVASIIIEAIACGLRIYFLNQIAGLSVKSYLKKVILKIFYPIIITIATIFFIQKGFEKGFLRLIVVSILTLLIFIPSVYILGMEKKEQQKFKTIIYKVLLARWFK